MKRRYDSYGTKRTNRAGLRMSVDRGRPEVTAERQTDAIDPKPTFGSRSAAAQHSVDDRPDQWRLLVRADFVSGLARDRPMGRNAEILFSELGSSDFLRCGDFNEIRPF
jgi:hypothetical protein